MKLIKRNINMKAEKVFSKLKTDLATSLYFVYSNMKSFIDLVIISLYMYMKKS